MRLVPSTRFVGATADLAGNFDVAVQYLLEAVDLRVEDDRPKEARV